MLRCLYLVSNFNSISIRHGNSSRVEMTVSALSAENEQGTNLSAQRCTPGLRLSTNVGHQGSMMIPLVPVIVSQNAYILYIRAPRFGDPVQGTAACRYERQAALSALCYPTSRKRGLILEVKCKMMSASRKRVVFLEKPLANFFVSS